MPGGCATRGHRRDLLLSNTLARIVRRMHLTTLASSAMSSALAGAFCVLAVALPRAQSAAPTLKKVTSFDLPGPGGKRFDYLTIADDRYLLSTHLAAGQTYVIDLRTNAVVATIADTPGAEGVECQSLN